MKSYCIIYFEHRNDVTSIVKLHRELLALGSYSLHKACDVISMFKINYTIALHGISVNSFRVEDFFLNQRYSLF